MWLPVVKVSVHHFLRELVLGENTLSEVTTSMVGPLKETVDRIQEK